jgi:hypothetical protein
MAQLFETFLKGKPALVRLSFLETELWAAILPGDSIAWPLASQNHLASASTSPRAKAAGAGWTWRWPRDGLACKSFPGETFRRFI